MIDPNLPSWLRSVHHDGSTQFVSISNPKIGDVVNIRLRTAQNARLKEVYLRTFPDGEQALAALSPEVGHSQFQWWHIALIINQPVVHYRFILISDDGMWAYTAAGVQSRIPLDNQDFRILADQHFPSWVRSAVFYQIFPDRFANGDSNNDPKPDEFDYKGYGPQTYSWEAAPDKDQPFPLVFYGGDLQGVRQKLDYMQQLGVNALYFNPIFSANSNHKYDVIDYYHVDRHFGGDTALEALREDLDKRSMHYVLDIVPNHCGYLHPWFLHAQSDKSSEEADFFTFFEHPDNYATWLGVWSLPKLNYNSETLRCRIYKDPDSVFRHWLNPPYRADGWRIDVANMLGRQGESQIGEMIISGIRNAVKETNPDSYLVGENFFDATSQLQGEQLDSVMNYSGFTHPLWYWLSHYREWAHSIGRFITAQKPLSTKALIDTWMSHLASIPWQIALQQFNLLGSHDTPRMKSIVQGNDILHRLAIIIQFTYPGVPCIYYGDEIGMQNDKILDSRGCMVWNESQWDKDLFSFYNKLIELRKKHLALQEGGFKIIDFEEDSFIYLRQTSTENILVVANRSPNPYPKRPISISDGGVPDGTQFKEAFSGEEIFVERGFLRLPTQRQGATLWIQTP